MRIGLGGLPDRYPAYAVSALACGALALVATSALAQSPSAEQSGLFQRQLSRPDNYELNYQYATAATQGRDYEAAIVALERLLYFNPNLSRAKYELGVLYLRMRSFAMAAHYFDAALATPGLEEQIRRRIEVMAPQARKELSPSRFYGTLQAGVGYDSNFTQSRGVAPMRSFGAWTLNPLAVPQVSGANATVLGDVLHVYDFQNGRGDLWETRVAGVTTLQPAYSAYSAGFVEASTGPRIALAPAAMPGLSIRPYLVGDYSSISGAGFAQSGGAGVSLSVPVGAFSLEPGVEYRRIDVSGSNLPFASQYVFNTGSLATASLAAQWRALDWLTFDGRALYRRNATAAPWTSSREFGLQGSAKVTFDPPVDTIGWRWSVTPFVRYASYAFDAADPSVDPWVTRRDRQWRTGAQFDMPVTPDWGVSALVQYSRTTSNIPNFNASSWSFLVGPTYRLTSLYDRRSAQAAARAPSANDWRGFHTGLNAGVDFGGTRTVGVGTAPLYALTPLIANMAKGSAALASGVGSAGGPGAAIGMQAGYDWLVSGAALLGVEASADFYTRNRGAQANAVASLAAPVANQYSTIAFTRSNDWLGTLRARAGYLIMPQLLAYGSAGAAFGGVRSSVATSQITDSGPGLPMTYWNAGSKTGVKLGYVVGGGLEWMFKPGWSVRAEYAYRNLGSVSYPMTPLVNNFCGKTCTIGVGSASTRFAASEVRAAIDYHFVLADAPAVTK
jgi:opacity protein-like surface antigen